MESEQPTNSAVDRSIVVNSMASDTADPAIGDKQQSVYEFPDDGNDYAARTTLAGGIGNDTYVGGVGHDLGEPRSRAQHVAPALRAARARPQRRAGERVGERERHAHNVGAAAIESTPAIPSASSGLRRIAEAIA